MSHLAQTQKLKSHISANTVKLLTKILKNFTWFDAMFAVMIHIAIKIVFITELT